ncbi:MAG TPA: M20/M25/M40 family metallo-hydrolase [Vicinamibacterales bacterium]|jgi:acetylornithine deacetylase/succinyl-diaminopimelate desuccinylase-like protein|nr:M20/M25/M40 family metallo-hydrolase [Vicinamibacterales bacterium]
MCARAVFASCIFCSIAFLGGPSGLGAQQRPTELGASLLQMPGVRAALDAARAIEPQLIEDQIRLCEVEAPPFEEARRAQMYAQMLRDAGLKNVRIDAEGNVLAERPGRQPRPNVVVSAHLDTVFPKGTAVKVRRDGAVLHGPGIGDDCRGLVDLLGVARVLTKSQIATPGTITFIGTVGEEGLGDLRGVKRLFNETLKDKIDRFVSIDGDGLGLTYIGVGSIRYRITFKGPGGHSFGSFGTVNPVHALGRAIAKIADLQVPSMPRTTFNVGRVGGGTSINTIASDAWMEVDLRSSDAQTLRGLEVRFRQSVQEAADQENARWGSSMLSVTLDVVGVRPPGRASLSSPIVQTAISVQKALNLPVSFAEGSTDSNLPLSLGIPALTIDTGGTGFGVHTEQESFDTTDAWKGTQRALLLAIALAQP